MYASDYKIVQYRRQPTMPSPQILVTPSSSEDLALHLPLVRDPLLAILPSVPDPASLSTSPEPPRHIYDASSLLSQTIYPKIQHLHIPDALVSFQAGIKHEILACPNLKTLEIVFNYEEAEVEASKFLMTEERAQMLRRRSSRLQGPEGGNDPHWARKKVMEQIGKSMTLARGIEMPKERLRFEIRIRGERTSEGGRSVEQELQGRPPIELVKSLVRTQNTYHCRFPGCGRSRDARGAGFAREAWRYSHEVSEHGPKGDCKQSCWFDGCPAGPFGEWKALCSHLRSGHGGKRLWAQKRAAERGEVFDPEYDGFESRYDNRVRFPYAHLEKFLQGLPFGCLVLLDLWVPRRRVTVAEELERMGICMNLGCNRWSMNYWDEE